MMKDLRKNEKSLGEDINIPSKGTMQVEWKIEYHDRHYQRILAYICRCNDGNFRVASHNNSMARIRVMKGSKSKTPFKALEKLGAYLKDGTQITPQWI